MSALASVIIPCYNQGRFLAEAIQSVIEQDYPAKEIIVVNDGSPDNTQQVAAAFGNVIAYIEQENRGLSGARNTGIRAAHGDYIAMLDSDDKYLPGFLSTQVGLLEANPDTGMVCSNAALFNENGNLGLWSDVMGRPRNPRNFRWETVTYCPPSCTVVLRRSCFGLVGLFDETLKNAAEDWLMWVQLSLYIDMAYHDKPTALIRRHGQNATRNLEQMAAGNRYAVTKVVNSLQFKQYPARFRARLLFYRFAASWRAESKTAAAGYFLRALTTAPIELPYGCKVIQQGLTNTLRRRGK